MSHRVLRITGLLLLLMASNCAFSQQRPLGTWKMFLPYSASVGICDADDKIFSAATLSLFSYEKSTGTIQIYDKASGLSDIGIKSIGYDPSTKYLVVAYNSSNLDLIYNGTDVYNIPDFKIENVSGSLGLNGTYFHDGNCYISTDMGISVLNLAKKEISNTYIIGSTGAQIRVFATSIDSVNIYAATIEGVKYAPLSSTNLLNFNSWHLYGAADSLPTKKAKYVAAYNNKVYAVIDGGTGTDTFYEYNGTHWRSIYSGTKETFTSLGVVNGNLYFTLYNDNGVTAGKEGKIDASGNFSINDVHGHVRPVTWFENAGVTWEGDSWNGFFKNFQGAQQSIIPDGPHTFSVYDLNIKDGALRVAPGGVDDSWEFTYNRDGFFIYKNNGWVSQYTYSGPDISNFSDILSTATVSSKSKSYFCSYYAGLIEYDDNTGHYVTYDKDNSILEGAQGDPQRTKLSALYTDAHDNLWIGNAQATKPIKVLGADGTWRGFSVPYNFEVMKRIIIDQNDQLWAPIRGVGGVLVWSYNHTLDDPSDDKSRILKSGTGYGGLPDENVYCVAEDRDGNIWVGTNQGIATYYCPGSILTSNGCDADLIKVTNSDGYIGYLFATESVRAIAVDAANRKWVGTTTGLWLISDDGKTVLQKFTPDNSPLPSKQVTDIVIDDKSGEVFIGTTGGLVSYQGDAIADCSDCDAALVYPNPVKPDYDGPIAIKGLADNAYVKITDISGVLVYQGKANGHQMIWNGKGYNGVRAKSGVYLVFSSTDLGQEKRVAKIVLIN